MRRAAPSLLVSAGLLVACGAQSPARVVTPDGPGPAVIWSDEDLAKDVAVRTLRVSESASFHRIRLAGAEPPHVHDRSDLTVFVLSGDVRMHLAGRVFPVGPGDVVEIPRGVPHWAENAGPGPGEAYVVFTPPLAPADRRPVTAEEAGR